MALKKINNIGRFVPLVLVLSVLFNMGCQKPEGGMTIAGSTSVEPFAELLAEEYMRLHPGAHIYVQGGGSTAGVEAARSRAADIGMSSRSLLPNENYLSAVMIARDAIALIVHPENQIRNLPLDQARNVFSGKIKRWRELGGPDQPIVLVTREEGSGTREAFQKFVMGKEEISLAALVQDSNGAIRQVVSSDPNAIGYISLGLVNEKVRALGISGVEASLSNIENGSYTLVRPFLFLFKGDPGAEAKMFVDFVLSPPAQNILSKEGLVSVLPRTPRE